VSAPASTPRYAAVRHGPQRYVAVNSAVTKITGGRLSSELGHGLFGHRAVDEGSARALQRVGTAGSMLGGCQQVGNSGGLQARHDE
jgi:hypothetical protein